MREMPDCLTLLSLAKIIDCPEGGEVLHIHMHFTAKKKKKTFGRWVSQVEFFWAATESKPAK